jgi:hypothetical protein
VVEAANSTIEQCRKFEGQTEGSPWGRKKHDELVGLFVCMDFKQKHRPRQHESTHKNVVIL